MSGNNYIDILFDSDDSGFYYVARRILSYMDIFDLLNFKHCCKLVYEFVDSCDNLENTAVRRRLKKEWNKPTLYQSKYKFNPINLNIIKVSKDNKIIAVCQANEAILFDITSCKESLILNGIHRASLSAFEFMYDESSRVKYFITCCRKGLMSLWSLNGECLMTKQLFGLICSLRSHDDSIVSSHFGLHSDSGCVTIRKVNTPTSIDVTFSFFNDARPILASDFNDNFVMFIEWTKFLGGVEYGSGVVCKRNDKTVFADLSAQLEGLLFSSIQVMNGSQFVTSDEHGRIQIWTTLDSSDVLVSLIRQVTISNHPIKAVDSVVDRLAICDSRGCVRLGDLESADENWKVMADSGSFTVSMSDKIIASGAYNRMEIVSIYPPPSTEFEPATFLSI